MFTRILLGYDGSEPAKKAFEQCLEMARCFGAQLSIAAGVLSLVISGWQYQRLVRYLWSPEFRPLAGIDSKAMKAMEPIYAQTPVVAVVTVVILIGLFTFVAVLWRMV
jgi:universal stress protein family protein